jgi:hypothetical protein
MQVVDYFNGKGDQPKESDVYSGMIEAAVYSKLEHCIFHRDVIDAMFRQVRSGEAIPYGQNIIKNKSVIQAVDYDLGRNGSAYYDIDTANYHVSGTPGKGNKGNTYRNDGVDIGKDSLHYEQYYVSDIEAGEWLQYTVNAETPGTYDLNIYFAAIEKKGIIDIILNGKVIRENLYLPATGDMKNWKPLLVRGVKLSGKEDRIRVKAAYGGFNLKQLEFVKSRTVKTKK